MPDKSAIRVCCGWLVCLAISPLASAQSFTIQTSNTTENLRGLSIVSPSIAWVSGTHGTYLRTLDGGMSWRAGQVPGAEALDFRDVQAFSAEQAYLLAAGPGEQSRIYKTNDAGKHWSLQFTNHDPKGFYDCMGFWDHDHGIVVGDPIDGEFALLATEDGGAHWSELDDSSRPQSLAEEGAFAASGTCLAVRGGKVAWFVTGGNAARVFRSINRGATWSAADVPVSHQGASAGIFSIAFGSDIYAVVAGGDYQRPDQSGSTLAYTEDGGITWTGLAIQPQPYVSAVALDPANPWRLLAVGSAHAAYTDDIQSAKWVAYWDLNLNAVAYLAPGEALAVGAKGLIVRFRLR